MTHENESAPAAATVQGAPDCDRSGDAITSERIGPYVPKQHHPLARGRMLKDRELLDLVEDIRANGQQEDIVLYEGKILDGRNRDLACRMAGIEPRYREFEGKDPVAFVISANVHRRHLTPEERQAALIELRVANPEKSDRQLAAQAGVAHTTMSRATKQAEATGAIAPVAARTGADGKKRKQPKKLTKAQKAEQAHRRHTRKIEAAKAREKAIAAQLPGDIYDRLDEVERAYDDFREHTVDICAARAEEIVDHVKAEAAARGAIAAWTRLGDGLRKKASPAGNDGDADASAEAMKTAHARAESAPAPATKKRRGRPPGSKNKKKA